MLMMSLQKSAIQIDMEVNYQAVHAQACSLDAQSQPGIARREQYFPISNMPFNQLRCLWCSDWWVIRNLDSNPR